MMSMGSLAHYMHDLGRAGFDIHSFLHEGNGEAWQYAVLGPRGYVTWLVIEERAEGGDALYQACTARPERIWKGSSAWPRVAGWRHRLYPSRRHPPWTRPELTQDSPCSQAEVDAALAVRIADGREAGRPAAEIDPVSEEARRRCRWSPLRFLVAELAADHPDVLHRARDAAEDDRADGVSVRDVAGLENRVVAEVDELADFAVAPVEEADAGADVGLNRRHGRAAGTAPSPSLARRAASDPARSRCRSSCVTVAVHRWARFAGRSRRRAPASR